MKKFTEAFMSWAKGKLTSAFKSKNMQFEASEVKEDGSFEIKSDEITMKESHHDTFDTPEEMMDYISEDVIEYGEDILEVNVGGVPQMPQDYQDRIISWIEDVKFDEDENEDMDSNTREEIQKINAMTDSQAYRGKMAIAKRIWVARWNNLNKQRGR